MTGYPPPPHESPYPSYVTTREMDSLRNDIDHRFQSVANILEGVAEQQKQTNQSLQNLVDEFAHWRADIKLIQHQQEKNNKRNLTKGERRWGILVVVLSNLISAALAASVAIFLGG